MQELINAASNLQKRSTTSDSSVDVKGLSNALDDVAYNVSAGLGLNCPLSPLLSYNCRGLAQKGLARIGLARKGLARKGVLYQF